MWRLVDRHRPILRKIKTRDDAEYWGHVLIGTCYPDVPRSRAASGKLAALVGLTDYMDFFCSDGYADLVLRGMSLSQARKVMARRFTSGLDGLDHRRKVRQKTGTRSSARAGRRR